EAGQAVDRVFLRRGLRSVLLGPSGLRLNGRPSLLRGRVLRALSEAQAQEYRAAGVNTVGVPAVSEATPIWDFADRVGFFVIGLISPDETALALANSLADRASSLGWLVDQDAVEQNRSLATWLRQHPQLRVGVRLTRSTKLPLAEGLRFVAGEPERLF